jgi:thioesterase domain-containing protein
MNAIHNWHILYSGFRQHAGLQTGMSRLWYEIRADLASPDTCVELRPWDEEYANMAEFVKLCQNETPPRIVLYGYSWGGFTATLLAKELQRRSLDVDHLVLCDAVYRHWYMLGWWRAFAVWKKIKIPANVRRVTWFRQQQSWPRGHALVAEDKATLIDPVRMLHADHVWMDDDPEFRKIAKQIAHGTLAPVETAAA